MTEEIRRELPLAIDTVGEAPDEPATIVLSCHNRRRLGVLLATHAERYRVHLASFREIRSAKRGPLAPLATHVEGARLTGCTQVPGERILVLDVQSRDRLGRTRPLYLVAELFGPRANAYLLDGEQRILWQRHDKGRSVGDLYPLALPLVEAASETHLSSPLFGRLPSEQVELVLDVAARRRPPTPTRFPPTRPVLAYVAPIFPDGTPYPTLSQALEDGYRELAALQLRAEAERRARRALAERRRNLEARLARLQAELRRTPDPETLRRQAELLLAYGWSLPEGAARLEATHWESGEQLSVELIPGVSIASQAQELYAAYEKAKRRRERLVPELKRLAAELERLSAVEAEAQRTPPAEATTPSPTEDRRGSEGPLRFRSSGGKEILVGRSSRQNDEITFRLARPDEFFVHAQNIPGAHVLLRSPNPSEGDLVEACLLAAYFSRARQGSNVPVDVTRRRFVRKPKGAPQGYVVYDHQQTYFVTPAGPKLEGLLRQLPDADVELE